MGRALVVVLLVACGGDDGDDDAASADAGPTDAGAHAGFPCGDGACARGMACCTSDGMGVCIATDMTCGGDTTECDGPEDCLTAPECCEGQCLPPDVACTGNRLCHEDADCPGARCCPPGTCAPSC